MEKESICKCDVTFSEATDYAAASAELWRCPMHKAAPDLLQICKEIADDTRVDLVLSERRLKLYCAIVKADPKWPGGNESAFNETAKKARG